MTDWSKMSNDFIDAWRKLVESPGGLHWMGEPVTIDVQAVTEPPLQTPAPTRGQWEEWCIKSGWATPEDVRIILEENGHITSNYENQMLAARAREQKPAALEPGMRETPFTRAQYLAAKDYHERRPSMNVARVKREQEIAHIALRQQDDMQRALGDPKPAKHDIWGTTQ